MKRIRTFLLPSPYQLKVVLREVDFGSGSSIPAPVEGQRGCGQSEEAIAVPSIGMKRMRTTESD
jgi:hypothetical protein